MRPLVFGKAGQVARALACALSSDVTTVFLGRDEADRTDSERCAAAIAGSDAEAIVNAVDTSWVFSADGSNLAKTMLRLGREHALLDVVANQIGGFTRAAAIAARAMIAAATGCLNHFAGRPGVSWADFARATMAEAKLGCRINNNSSNHYPMPARRPLNSGLDCADFESHLGISRPDWRSGLTELVEEFAR